MQLLHSKVPNQKYSSTVSTEQLRTVGPLPSPIDALLTNKNYTTNAYVIRNNGVVQLVKSSWRLQKVLLVVLVYGTEEEENPLVQIEFQPFFVTKEQKMEHLEKGGTSLFEIVAVKATQVRVLEVVDVEVSVKVKVKVEVEVPHFHMIQEAELRCRQVETKELELHNIEDDDNKVELHSLVKVGDIHNTRVEAPKEIQS